jgi:4-aminobutyrate aminotransferase-like enzyme
VREEAEKGRYVPQFLTHPDAEAFADRLIELAPGGRLSRAFRCTSGSEAVEMAIKCARAATGKPVIVSIDGVYHGHTYGAAAVGDACTPAMAPCPEGFLKVPMPHPRYGGTPEETLAALDRILGERDDIAAFLSEPVFTNAGAIVPPPDLMPAIERRCRDRGILFVMDEVATGFGRCGRLFGSELWGLSPDVLCLGKGFTGGYATMAATLVTEEIYGKSAGLPTYSTFGWVPLDLAATRANVEAIVRDRLWENAGRVGGALLERLRALEDLPFVAEVRGSGLLVAVEIVRDKASMAPDRRRANRIMDRCAEEGVIIETAGHALFLSPPLTLTPEEAEEGAEVIERVAREG